MVHETSPRSAKATKHGQKQLAVDNTLLPVSLGNASGHLQAFHVVSHFDIVLVGAKCCYAIPEAALKPMDRHDAAELSSQRRNLTLCSSRGDFMQKKASGRFSRYECPVDLFMLPDACIPTTRLGVL